MQKAAQAYLQTQVTTTNQGEVVVLLYEGAIKFLNKAKELLAVNDMGGKGNCISKALDVIDELDSSLNKEKGGDLAKNLHNLYDFCSRHLVMANLKKSPEMIDEVIRILSGLRNAYAEILNTPEAQEAAREAAVNMKVGAQPIRSQAGMASSGGAMPVPGAAARMRAMYAGSSGDKTVANPGERKEPAPEEAASQSSVASIPATPQAFAERTDSITPKGDESFMGMGQLPPKLPGAGLYRKYAAMQK